MKAAIYNPYLDTLGGGERYSMAAACVFANSGYEVDVQWRDNSIKTELEKRFGIDLKEINFIKDIKKGDGYEICFWVSDGSIPLLRARNNILHFQVPFIGVNGKTLINKMKLIRISKIVCNSRFTRNIIEKEYGVKSLVIYPPVDINKIRPKRKSNIILSVGRFSQLTQAKRQDILVKAFIRLCKVGIDDWEFVLAGGSDVGVDDYIEKLVKMSKGFPVKIIENPNYNTIKDLFGVSKIFWTASGFGISVDDDPKKVEHFGISVVEAMAAKSVPIVFAAGGHKEIVKDNINGILWKSTSALVRKTAKLINNPKQLRSISKNAKKDSVIYSYERFESELQKIF
jgi:glycosyltransferase involved in cell wall biosynthesis